MTTFPPSEPSAALVRAVDRTLEPIALPGWVVDALRIVGRQQGLRALDLTLHAFLRCWHRSPALPAPYSDGAKR